MVASGGVGEGMGTIVEGRGGWGIGGGWAGEEVLCYEGCEDAEGEAGGEQEGGGGGEGGEGVALHDEGRGRVGGEEGTRTVQDGVKNDVDVMVRCAWGAGERDSVIFGRWIDWTRCMEELRIIILLLN